MADMWKISVYTSFICTFLVTFAQAQTTQTIIFTPLDDNVTRSQDLFNEYFYNESDPCLGKYKFNLINLPSVQLYPTMPMINQVHANYVPNISLLKVGKHSYYGTPFFDINLSNSFPKLNPVRMIDYFEFEPRDKRRAVYHIVTNFTAADPIVELVLVLNETYVDGVTPWEGLQLDHSMSPDFVGRFHFLYYKTKADASLIARKIRDGNIHNMVIQLNQEASLELIREAYLRNLFQWDYRWMFFFSDLSKLNMTFLNLRSISSNVTFIDFGSDTDENLDLKSESDVIAMDMLNATTSILRYGMCNEPLNFTAEYNTGTVVLNTDLQEFGKRETWQLQIYNLKETGFADKIGTFTMNVDGSFMDLQMKPIANMNMTKAAILDRLRDRGLRVLVILEEPFVMIREHKYAHEPLKDRLSGFCIDLLNEMLRRLNVTADYDQEGDTLDLSTFGNQYSGSVDRLAKGYADFLVGPFTDTLERRKLLDLSTHWLQYKNSVLLKPASPNPIVEMFQFLWPFHPYVWMTILGSMLGYAITLAIVHAISPNRASYNFRESLYFSLGSMVHGVTTEPPDKPSGRVLVCFWWFFNIILVVTYVANYAAFRTELRLVTDINSVQDLLTSNYKYGTIKNSIVLDSFRTSTFENAKKMYHVMTVDYSEFLFSNVTEAMEQVKQGDYAFIFENPVNSYRADRACLTNKAPYGEFYYNFPMQKGAEFKEIINEQIEDLKREGYIDMLSKKYLKQDRTVRCLAQEEYSILKWILNILDTEFLPKNKNSLEIRNTAGIFIIMIIGSVFSILIATIEFIVRKIRNACKCCQCCKCCSPKKKKHAQLPE